MAAADHILVVDDDTEIRDLLKEYLTRQGYHVTAVADGPSMEQAMEDAHFDLVVLRSCATIKPPSNTSTSRPKSECGSRRITFQPAPAMRTRNPRRELLG